MSSRMKLFRCSRHSPPRCSPCRSSRPGRTRKRLRAAINVRWSEMKGRQGFSLYISRVADVGAVYGTFAGAIVLVGWLWLTNVALLFGAELNAEIERQKELSEVRPPSGRCPSG